MAQCHSSGHAYALCNFCCGYFRSCHCENILWTCHRCSFSPAHPSLPVCTRCFTFIDLSTYMRDQNTSTDCPWHFQAGTLRSWVRIPLYVFAVVASLLLLFPCDAAVLLCLLVNALCTSPYPKTIHVVSTLYDSLSSVSLRVWPVWGGLGGFGNQVG